MKDRLITLFAALLTVFVALLIIGHCSVTPMEKPAGWERTSSDWSGDGHSPRSFGGRREIAFMTTTIRSGR